jgi:hypothetical protein
MFRCLSYHQQQFIASCLMPAAEYRASFRHGRISETCAKPSEKNGWRKLYVHFTVQTFS